MKVALLAPLPPVRSGIADYAVAWRAALQARGVEVAVPAMPDGADLPAEWPDVGDAAWQGVDVVHAEIGGGRSREFLALERLRQRRPDLPLTATVHDPERLVWRAPVLPPVLRTVARWPRPWPQLAMLACDRATLARERALAAGLSAMVTLTATGASCLAERMRVPAENVRVIPHGNALPPPEHLADPVPLRLLYFGFIYPGKGIEDLLAAVQRVARDHAGAFRLTLAGGSAPELAFGPRGDYVAGLREQVRARGLEGMVDWQLDLPAEHVPALIGAHHALVLPYRESRKLSLLGRMRGTSGALSWACACGRGAIASDARAFPEEVSHGNGRVYPQGDVAALAESIVALIRDPAMVRQWAAQAAALGRQRAWPEVAGQFAAFFERVVAEGRP